MRNILKYFYNLSVNEIKEYSNYCILTSDKGIYIFKMISNREQIVNVYNEMLAQTANVHKIVLNKQGEYVTKIDYKEYMLLELYDMNKLINNNFEFYYTNKKEDHIPEIWSNKIDYYMQEIRKIGVEKKVLVDAFNYYIGLSENAISIYNRTLQEIGNIRYVVSHRRISYPNYAINYYDPTKMFVDSISRDISEYIKSKMLNDSIENEEIIGMIANYDLNEKEIKILYSRLLFPSYFFDEVEKCINGNYDEEKIVNILNKRKYVEIKLKELYLCLKKTNQLPEIDWLIHM